MDDSLYVLKTVPPVRVLVLAAATTLVGAVLLVISLQQNWHVAITVLAAALLVAGLAIVAVAFLLDHRLAVRIKLTKDGYSVTGTNINHQGEWVDVTKVTESLDHRHVTIYHGVVRRTHLLFPAANDQQLIVEVLTDIRGRLVAVKGG